MGYRKARIPIRLHSENRVDYRDGYIFEACFSTGVLFEMGVYKQYNKGNAGWIISDLNTGMAVTYGKTRVDAVKQFQDFYLSKLERMVYSNEHYSCVPSCNENWYEHATAEFSTMLELKEGAK